MMPGIQMQEILQAMVSAYDKDSLEMMLSLQMEKNLGNIVADAPLRTKIFKLLQKAEQEGWDIELVKAAHRYIPGNTPLARAYEKYGMAPGLVVEKAGQPVAKVPSGVFSSGLEKTIRQDNPALDINLWRTRLTQLEVRVCRVDINGGPSGTGFLIAEDLVLTNYHVVMGILNGGRPASSLSCRFDYKVLVDGTVEQGIRIPLRAGNEIPLHSKCSAAELTKFPDSPVPTLDELDFALLKLSRALGSEPLAGPASAARGWETLPYVPAMLLPDQGLIIAQHPQGEPMKLAIDTQSVIGANANGTRVRYQTNTEGGSSGSGVYDMLFNLVALHHLGDPARDGSPPQYNQAVLPLHLIRQKITDAGFEI